MELKGFDIVAQCKEYANALTYSPNDSKRMLTVYFTKSLLSHKQLVRSIGLSLSKVRGCRNIVMSWFHNFYPGHIGTWADLFPCCEFGG